MQAGFTTRPFRKEDYDAVVELWHAADGIEVAEGDSRDDIAAYLLRNPDLSRVAEEGRRIIGAVLCGHDGRRGLIYHLAVTTDCRGKGVGQRLVGECITGLRACNIQRALLLVARDNQNGRDFWHSRGFEEIEALPLGIDVPST
jgi:ribosomal protein S18 acetylase RimI-like enzyme